MGNYERAEALLAAGRREQAIELLEKMIAADPSDPLPYSRLALARTRSQKAGPALAALAALGKLAPGTVLHHRTSAYVLRDLSQFHPARTKYARKAARHFKAWLTHEPENPYAYAGLALVQARATGARRFALARKAAARAVQLAPLDTQVLSDVAAAYSHMRMFNAAEQLLRQGLASDPTSAVLLERLATALAGQGRTVEASDALVGLAQSDPQLSNHVLARLRQLAKPSVTKSTLLMILISAFARTCLTQAFDDPPRRSNHSFLDDSAANSSRVQALVSAVVQASEEERIATSDSAVSSPSSWIAASDDGVEDTNHQGSTQQKARLPGWAVALLLSLPVVVAFATRSLVRRSRKIRPRVSDQAAAALAGHLATRVPARKRFINAVRKIWRR